MTKLSKGILTLTVLVSGFLLVDVPARTVDTEMIIEGAGLDPITTANAPDNAPHPTPIPGLLQSVLTLPGPDRFAAAVSAESSPMPSSSPSPEPSPASSSTPWPTQTRELTEKTIPPADTVFDALMTPFVNEAQKRRAETAKIDPEYAQRIDAALNAGRINFLLFGYGETHEPPATELATIGSHTIVSYDLKRRRADVISLTHDIRAPEIERELVKKGWKKAPVMRMDHAYEVGGFPLMRRLLENATGLSIDFQLSFRDAVIQPLVDNVFGGVEVDVPMAFDVHPFYLDGKKYDKGHFMAGRQKLSGRQVIQFIKTVPIAEGAYHPSLEHNVRKALILTALLDGVELNYRDSLFWLKGSAFVTGELISGSIAYDFDPVSLIVNNIGTTTTSLRRSLAKSSSNALLPKIGKTRYIVDPAQGDGGVQWVGANAAINPHTRKDMDEGFYQSTDVEVPITANPYGNLVTEYWPSVREVVHQALMSNEP